MGWQKNKILCCSELGRRQKGALKAEARNGTILEKALFGGKSVCKCLGTRSEEDIITVERTLF